MSNTPLVSVIIPTYKGSTTIRRAIESVISQSYKNLEIYIIDDNGKGSNEQVETEKVICCFLSDPRVKYIVHKENMRGSVARNTGIHASSGEYLAFLDDDDVWFSSKITRQIEVFQTLSPEFGMMYCGAYNVDSQGRGGKVLSSFPEGNILYNFLIGKVIFNSSTLVIRRSVLEKVDGFMEEYRRLQDWEFCTRILYYYKGYGLKEYLVMKYREERNLTSKPEQLRDIYEYHIFKIQEILNSLGNSRSKNVTARFYRRIALEYFKYNNIPEGIRYLHKDQSLLKGTVLLSKYILSHGIYRIANQNKTIIKK